MNSKFNILFSHLPKLLIAFRIMKLESTIKITAQFKVYPQCLSCFVIILLHIFEKRDIRVTYFLVAFVCLYSLTVPLPFDVHSLNLKLVIKFNFLH